MDKKNKDSQIQGNGLFKNLVDSFSDILIAIDSQLKIVYWNKTVRDLTGYSSEEVINKPILEIFPWMGDTTIPEKYLDVLKSKKPRSFFEEFEINNDKRVFGINLYPNDGGLTIFARDITAYFNSEMSFRKSNELFRSTLDNMLEGCAILDTSWRYIYLNDVHAAQAKIDKETAPGKSILELIPGFEKSSFFETFQRTMEQHVSRQIEDCFTFNDGSTSWFQTRSVPVPEGIFIISDDITERKQNEEDLFRYHSVINQTERMAKMGSWWIDMRNGDDVNQNPLYWSEEVYRIFGYEPFSVKVNNEFFFDCVHPDDRSIIRDEMSKALSQNKPYEAEHRIIRPDGTIRIVYEHAEIRTNNEGIPEIIVGAVQDITEFRQSQQEREKLLNAIEQDRDMMRSIIESVPDEIWVFNANGELILVNSAVKDGIGVDNVEDLTLQNVLETLEIRHLDGKIRKPEESALYFSLKGVTVNGEEIIRHLKTGEYRYRHFHSAPMKDNNGNIFGVVVIVSDITERRKAEEKERELLQIYQRRTAELNTIIEAIPDAVFIGNEQGMTLVNSKALTLLGAESMDDFRKNVKDIAREVNIRWPDSREPLKEDELQFRRALKGETVIDEVLATNKKTGEDIYLRVAAAPVITDGQIIAAVAVDSDMTEKKKYEAAIKASLKEKDVLLRELYHRTKNNLQVISSLLGLKASDKNDPVVTEILEDMKNRVQTIALVHQKLYQSQNLSRVNIREYISDLVSLLKQSYLVAPEKVDFMLVLEDINVLIDTAVPCGLIINELISNSLKYAFPGDRKGTVSISFVRLTGDYIELKVSDDGIGMKLSEDRDDYSLGLKLFYIIAEEQLQAEIKLDTSAGVSWSIIFKDILYDERI